MYGSAKSEADLYLEITYSRIKRLKPKKVRPLTNGIVTYKCYIYTSNTTHLCLPILHIIIIFYYNYILDYIFDYILDYILL